MISKFTKRDENVIRPISSCVKVDREGMIFEEEYSFGTAEGLKAFAMTMPVGTSFKLKVVGFYPRGNFEISEEETNAAIARKTKEVLGDQSE